MENCKIANTENNAVPFGPQRKDAAQLELDTPVSCIGRMRDYILKNPAGFIFDPEAAAKIFQDSDFAESHEFFSANHVERFVYSVCSSHFHSRCPTLDLELYVKGMSEFRQSRFWPFWYFNDLKVPATVKLEQVQKRLLDLWNITTGMFYQTGFLEIEDSLEAGGFFFFKCILPIYRSGGRKPDTITFGFDPTTKSFYTINARVHYEEPEYRFKYVEFVGPHENPPNLRKFIHPSDPQQWKVLLVLDRHIGENLSLFTTHISYLSKIPQFSLVLDSSMCPIFQESPPGIIQRFLPEASNVALLKKPLIDRTDFDLVFDPYDWLPDIFDRKPQNDSSAVGIVSALEYGRCCLHRKRRDILDIHMNSLKRMGIAPSDEPIPEFIRYRISTAERLSIRQKFRAKLVSRSSQRKSAKLVTFFPYGLSENRRYPVESLRTIIGFLLRDPDVYVMVAGTNYDTPEMIQTARGYWQDVQKTPTQRIRIFSNEPLVDLTGIILASDVVISMDSGPLHLARSLRVNPIGLYTKKVNDEESLLRFPWLVEDGTADVLKPNSGQDHVFPDQVISAIQKRLNFLPFA